MKWVSAFGLSINKWLQEGCSGPCPRMQITVYVMIDTLTAVSHTTARYAPMLGHCDLLGQLVWTACYIHNHSQNTIKISYKRGSKTCKEAYSSLWYKHCTATETHMLYGITQCYLPPGRGDIPVFHSSQLRLVLDLATPEGCNAEMTCFYILYIMPISPFHCSGSPTPSTPPLDSYSCSRPCTAVHFHKTRISCYSHHLRRSAHSKRLIHTAFTHCQYIQLDTLHSLQSTQK